MYNIVFAGDDKYIKYISVAITSIVMNTDKSKTIKDFQASINKQVHGESFISSEDLTNSEEGYHFHVLADSISDDTKQKLSGLEEELNKIFPTKISSYVFSDKEFRGFRPWHSSYLIFYRFKIAEIFSQENLKILYLDGDMLILSDVRELFAVDLKEESFMAVSENGVVNRRIEKLKFSLASDEEKSNIDFTTIPNVIQLAEKYFNSGLLLINLDLWRKNEIGEKAKCFLQNYDAPYCDQDALNWLSPNYKELPDAWNVLPMEIKSFYTKHEELKELPYTSEEYPKIIKKSNIIKNNHYGAKPWASEGIELVGSEIDMSYLPMIKIWWQMAENVPCFKDDLLLVKQSKSYISKTSKQKRLIKLSKSPLAFKIYLTLGKCNSKIKAITNTIEKPIKQIRNKIRYKLANK